MKILMVLTSHDELGSTGRKTGFWLEELAAPYYAFRDAGAEVVLASPKGGQPPLDPKSNEPSFQTDLTRRFEADASAKAQLATTVRLDGVSQAEFDTVFYPGGHGPLWDLAEDRSSIALIQAFLDAGKPIALVCHAPGVLRHAKATNGQSLVAGKKVTGFANTEEAAVELTKIVPFLVEDELKTKGGIYSKGPDWAPHVVRDGLLITGQNPASSAPAAASCSSSSPRGDELDARRGSHDLGCIDLRIAGGVDAQRVVRERRVRGGGRVLAVEVEAGTVAGAHEPRGARRHRAARVSAQRRERVESTRVATHVRVDARHVLRRSLDDGRRGTGGRPYPAARGVRCQVGSPGLREVVGGARRARRRAGARPQHHEPCAEVAP